MAFSVVWFDHHSERMNVGKSTRMNNFIEIDKMIGSYNRVGSGKFFIPADAKFGGL